MNIRIDTFVQCEDEEKLDRLVSAFSEVLRAEGLGNNTDDLGSNIESVLVVRGIDEVPEADTHAWIEQNVVAGALQIHLPEASGV